MKTLGFDYVIPLVPSPWRTGAGRLVHFFAEEDSENEFVPVKFNHMR